MHVIFINRFFYPDHSATSQMLSDLAFALVGPDARISVITSRQRYDAPNETLPANEAIRGVSVNRVWTTRFGRGHLVGRALDYATFYLSCARRLWRLARNGDVVVAKTDPPVLSVLIVPLAKLRGAKTVNWLQDLFPEVAMVSEIGQGRLAKAVFGVIRSARNASLRSADLNVAIGDRMAERLEAIGVLRDKIDRIPNWADGTAVKSVPHDQNPLRSEWGLEGAFVVGYSGNLGRAHEYETFLSAAELIENKGTHPIVWLFIGGGALYETFEQRVQARGLRSIRFKPYQPRDQLSFSLSVPDVHLVSLRPDMEGLVVPSKFYGIAAAGRPTLYIGDEDGEVGRIVRGLDIGLAVRPGDGTALAEAIMRLAEHPSRVRDMGHRARRAFDEGMDVSARTQQWRTALTRLSK